jgi:hypothetical protein
MFATFSLHACGLRHAWTTDVDQMGMHCSQSTIARARSPSCSPLCTAQLCEQHVAGWGAMSPAERAAAVVTVCDTSEFNRVMFACPPPPPPYPTRAIDPHGAAAGARLHTAILVDDSCTRPVPVVVSMPSSAALRSPAEAANKAAVALFLSDAGVSPNVLGTLHVTSATRFHPSDADQADNVDASGFDVQVSHLLSGERAQSISSVACSAHMTPSA